jgi:hypothetical protein
VIKHLNEGRTVAEITSDKYIKGVKNSPENATTHRLASAALGKFKGFVEAAGGGDDQLEEGSPFMDEGDADGGSYDGCDHKWQHRTYVADDGQTAVHAAVCVACGAQQDDDDDGAAGEDQQDFLEDLDPNDEELDVNGNATRVGFFPANYFTPMFS